MNKPQHEDTLEMKASGDHLIVLRCAAPESSGGGIIIPDRERSENPVSYGRIMSVGADCGFAPGDVAVFDESEAEEMEFRTDHGSTPLIFLRSEAVRATMTKYTALYLGVDYPNLKKVRKFAESFGLISA